MSLLGLSLPSTGLKRIEWVQYVSTSKVPNLILEFRGGGFEEGEVCHDRNTHSQVKGGGRSQNAVSFVDCRRRVGC